MDVTCQDGIGEFIPGGQAFPVAGFLADGTAERVTHGEGVVDRCAADHFAEVAGDKGVAGPDGVENRDRPRRAVVSRVCDQAERAEGSEFDDDGPRAECGQSAGEVYAVLDSCRVGRWLPAEDEGRRVQTPPARRTRESPDS